MGVKGFGFRAYLDMQKKTFAQGPHKNLRIIARVF